MFTLLVFLKFAQIVGGGESERKTAGLPGGGGDSKISSKVIECNILNMKRDRLRLRDPAATPHP
jgi:hypothetical protein